MYGSHLEHDQKRGFLMRFDDALTFPPQPPFLSHAAGEEEGDYAPSPSPQPLPFLPGVWKRREVSVAVAILRLRLATMLSPPTKSPLSRAAGEGLGVRAALTFPPAPFLSHAAGEEGGDYAPTLFPPASSAPTMEEEGGERSGSNPVPASCNDAESTN